MRRRPFQAWSVALVGWCLVVGLGALLLGQVAEAFNMNPVSRPHGLIWVPKAILDKVKEPVHEIMTVIAYDCHQRVETCAGRSITWNRTSLSTKLGRLIDGVEWNDDPTLRLRGSYGGALTWGIFMGDAERIARCRRDNPRPETNCKRINEKYDLLYRSHYGDLQFLHAMGSHPEEPAAETRDKMLVWAEYTYKLAIGEIGAEEPLAHLRNPAVDRYVRRGSWTSRLLFTRDKRELRADTAVMALGSLLHMVQDSFSDAHAHRRGSCNRLVTEKGSIEEFHNYALQNATEHARADVMPEWLSATALAGSNPVTASAHLIRFALETKEPWENVRPWLADEVFALGAQPRSSGPGSADCFAGD